MPTLAEVAKKAGVSVATVSKVLSNTPYFSEETRIKVMKAVNELGYVPNRTARALATGKTYIIGVVFPRVFDAIFTDPLVQHILEGVESVCNESGYNILLITPRLQPDGPDASYTQLIESRAIDGVVALDNVPTASVLIAAEQSNLPAVAIGYGPHDIYVRSDDHQGAYDLMTHVLELGHRHIAIISVDTALNYAVEARIAGIKEAAQNQHIDFDSIPIFYGDFSTKSGVQRTETILATHPETTAIVCINDRMALGAIQQARTMGYAVPDDLSVVGYDDIPLAQFVDPPLTTVNQGAPELGKRATQMLLELIKGRDVQSEIIPTHLRVRSSSSNVKNIT